MKNLFPVENGLHGAVEVAVDPCGPTRLPGTLPPDQRRVLPRSRIRVAPLGQWRIRFPDDTGVHEIGLRPDGDL